MPITLIKLYELNKNPSALLEAMQEWNLIPRVGGYKCPNVLILWFFMLIKMMGGDGNATTKYQNGNKKRWHVVGTFVFVKELFCWQSFELFQHTCFCAFMG